MTALEGALVSFPAVESLTDVSLYSSAGSEILFPVATSYVDSSSGGSEMIQALGVGSRVDLSALATFEGYSTELEALAGGWIGLSGAFSGTTVWTQSGAGSAFEVSGVTSLSGATLTATSGAVWEFPVDWEPSWGEGCSLEASGLGSQFVNRAVLRPTDATVAVNTDVFVNQGDLAPQNSDLDS